MAAILLSPQEAEEVLEHAKSILGKDEKKTGRYIYKNHHRCDFAVVRESGKVTLFCSGGLRFRTVLKILASGTINATVSPVGPAEDYSPSALIDIIKMFAEQIFESRQRRIEQEAARKKAGTPKPGFSENIGWGFSVKATDKRIAKEARISDEQSELNFELAKKERHLSSIIYHILPGPRNQVLLSTYGGLKVTQAPLSI